ncbi:hypothetical protein F4780DRAFT_780567 [Xylariomycetidae sp. FL0641]|nr:hypothetical protein F4780DRAFT_780567 [Xylariomycetidae sp. FL0641]
MSDHITMEFPHIPYQDSIYFTAYMDSPEMDLPLGAALNPKVKRTASPDPFMEAWSPPEVHRFMAEHNKASCLRYPMAEPVLPGTVTASFPSAIYQRRDSPSFSQPSSTCSMPLSPPSQSDGFQMQSPKTPTAPMSPYTNQYEGCGTVNHLCQYTGMADAFVNPTDVNLFHETPLGFYDEDAHKPLPPSRLKGSESRISSPDEGGSCDGSFGAPRHLSPESMAPDIKEEICIPENDVNYPSFDTEDDATDSGEAEFLLPKQEEGDDEYRPSYKKPKHTSSNPSRKPKSRKRPSTIPAMVDAKRMKTEVEDPILLGTPAKSAIQGARGQYTCVQCPKPISFKDEKGLETHTKKQHQRPFTCVFQFAGCESTFASKNEWKRHCGSQHLVLKYWICQQEQCAKVTNNPTGHRASLARSADGYAQHGTVFNRKDLYTQHIRRMHMPSTLKKQLKQKNKAVPQWDEQERRYQDEALRTRCKLPTHMRCPAVHCNARFDGSNAWDERMEHVAKHLEKSATESETGIQFGGDHDPTLMEWAASPHVAIVTRNTEGGWELNNPLKPDRHCRKHTVKVKVEEEEEDEDEDDEDDEDADAEGEVVDDE